MSRRSRPARLHGVLIIDKPAGWTSHDVVARVRRLVGEKKVGHSGTLDPMATGVLPVGVGDATRMIEYLSDAGKRYIGDVTFGIETDTLDAEGMLTAMRDASHLSDADIISALGRFHGSFDQLPPMHAAIKIDGVKLYELARQGIEVERATRPVTVYEIALLAWNPPVATIDVSCSKGFYVRSLARDLGNAVGTGAHLSNLVRVASGPFSLADTWTLSELSEFDRDDFSEQWPSIAVHPDAMVGEAPALILNGDTRRRWINGVGFTAPTVTSEIVSVYADTGEWMGTGSGDPSRNMWVPDKVTIDRTTAGTQEEKGTE
jgi:tRNA pseudouridine55 synthase